MSTVNNGIKIAFALVGVVSLLALLRKFGILSDNKEKAIASFEKSGKINPLNYKLFKVNEKKDGYKRSSINSTKEIKGQAWDLFSILDKTNVPENEVISKFKKMQFKNDVYMVNAYIIEKYKMDIWNKMVSSLNDNELFEIVKYIVKLPNYIKE